MSFLSLQNLNFFTLKNLELVAQFTPSAFASFGFVRQTQQLWPTFARFGTVPVYVKTHPPLSPSSDNMSTTALTSSQKAKLFAAFVCRKVTDGTNLYGHGKTLKTLATEFFTSPTSRSTELDTLIKEFTTSLAAPAPTPAVGGGASAAAVIPTPAVGGGASAAVVIPTPVVAGASAAEIATLQQSLIAALQQVTTLNLQVTALNQNVAELQHQLGGAEQFIARKHAENATLHAENAALHAENEQLRKKDDDNKLELGATANTIRELKAKVASATATVQKTPKQIVKETLECQVSASVGLGRVIHRLKELGLHLPESGLITLIRELGYEVEDKEFDGKTKHTVKLTRDAKPEKLRDVKPKKPLCKWPKINNGRCKNPNCTFRHPKGTAFGDVAVSQPSDAGSGGGGADAASDAASDTASDAGSGGGADATSDAASGW